MKNLSSDFFNQLEYKFIFEYYDEPLAFISNFKNKNYFFYMMDDNFYFIKELDRDNINFIFSDVSINNILEDFEKSGDLKVLKNDNHVILYNLNEYNTLYNDKWAEYFPEDELYFEYDYLTHKSFAELKNEYKRFFPEHFGINTLLYKLIDPYNSHIMLADTVSKVIDYVQKYVNHSKKYLEEQGKFTNQELKLVPFGQGSFEINFIIDENEEKALFNEPVLFDDMVDSFYALEHYDAEYIFKRDFFSAKEYKETKNLIMFMEEKKIEVELLDSKKQKIGAIKPNKDLLNKFEKIDYMILQEEESLVETETKKFEGEVRSASKERNYLRIKLRNGQRIQAKFSKELFREIKDSIRSVTVSSTIHGEFKIERYYDKDNELIDEKYIILNYTQ